jgi:hypothetical protein
MPTPKFIAEKVFFDFHCRRKKDAYDSIKYKGERFMSEIPVPDSGEDNEKMSEREKLEAIKKTVSDLEAMIEEAETELSGDQNLLTKMEADHEKNKTSTFGDDEYLRVEEEIIELQKSNIHTQETVIINLKGYLREVLDIKAQFEELSD